MEYLLVAFVCGFMTIGSANYSGSLDIKVPEINGSFFDEVLAYLPCVSRQCKYSVTETPESNKTPVPTYEKFCTDIFHGWHDIDEKYPKLKELKSKLYAYFYSSLSEYETNTGKRKTIALEVLSEIIKLLQMLKEKIELCSVPAAIVTPTYDIIAEEEEYPGFVGSVRGIPGVHYPNYTEVPLTSFSCSDKKYIPGFYADLETGCQVFHVCYQHRRESFLCPTGTLFNQPILACDYWYSSNCSLAPHYYEVNEEKPDSIHLPEKSEDSIEDLISTIIEQDKQSFPEILVKSKETMGAQAELDKILQFLPVKAKITEFPEKTAPLKPLPLLQPQFVKTAVKIPAKVVSSKALPVVEAKVVSAIKTKVASKAVPVKAIGVTKAKLASVPIVKSIPVIKAKAAAIPLVKSKVSAAAVPLLKAKTMAKVLPVVKTAAAIDAKLIAAKKVKAAAAIDAKLLAAAKVKKSVLISPLTKKALALGYLKLLKAKKMSMLG